LTRRKAAAHRPAAAQPGHPDARGNLGVALFERTSRHVALTDPGAQLVPAAREALAATDHAVNVAAA